MDFKTAADDVRKLTRYFESLNGIVAVLDSVASIDQARTEAQARLQAVLVEHGKVEEQIGAKVAQLNELNRRVDEAADQVGQNIERAKADGERILAEAQAACDEERKKLAAAKEDAKRAENEESARLDAIEDQILAKSAELETLNEKIAQARATIQGMLA
jgi:chromosome segregation ATPase